MRLHVHHLAWRGSAAHTPKASTLSTKLPNSAMVSSLDSARRVFVNNTGTGFMKTLCLLRI